MVIKLNSVCHFLIVFISVTIFNIGYGFSQNALPSVIPPSPTAGELAKYITYPVDLSNGLVKISIPLYEIVDGDIRIPITLNYHASGLKPSIQSNNFLSDGWSLNTGPSLSRNINGGPDESYYFYDLDLHTQPTFQQLNFVANGYKDIALDEFHYSLLNTSGRLYFKRNVTNQLRPVTIPIDPIKISLPVVNDYKNFINISDTKGLQYSFGGTERKFKDFTMYPLGGYLEVATAWKINNIYSPLTNRTVSFDYSSNLTEAPYYLKNDAVTMIDDICCQTTATVPAVKVSGSTNHYYIHGVSQMELTDASNIYLPDNYSFPMDSPVAAIQSNSYIQKISFTGGYVIFNKFEGGRRGLTSIRVYNKGDNLVKQIEFIQSISGPSDVLTLNEIKISTPESVDVEKHSFLYNGVFTDKGTRSIDRWGYYNAANNTSLVPPITTTAIKNNHPLGNNSIVTVAIPGGNREPNENAMKFGVLTAIIHPTGGMTDFTYEAHRYLESNAMVKLAGGLRIKQIRELDGFGNVIYKNYNYSTLDVSVNGAGILNVIPIGGADPSDKNFIYNTEKQCFTFISLTPHLSFKERRWSDNSMVNLFSENGSSVSYPYVIETTSADAQGNMVIGKNLYSFKVSTSYPQKFGNTDIVTDARDGWSKGNLISKTSFKKNTFNQFDTVSRKSLSYNLEYSYGNDDDKITQAYAYKNTRVIGADEFMINDLYKKIDYRSVYLSTGRLLLSKESGKTYSDNGKVEATVSFDHDSYGNVIQTIRNTSVDEKMITVNTYAKDMVDQGRDPLGTYANMVTANILSIPVEVKTYKNSVSSANLLTTNTSDYSKFNNTLFAPKEIVSKVKNDPKVRKTLLNNYDSYGNLLEVQHLDGAKSVYLWGYNGQYPVAKIENGSYEEVLTALGGGTTATNILNSLNVATVSELTIKTHIQTLRANLSKAKVSTYTYKPLVGMTSMTDPRGITETYQYDGLQRLKGILDFEGNMRKHYQYHYKP